MTNADDVPMGSPSKRIGHRLDHLRPAHAPYLVLAVQRRGGRLIHQVRHHEKTVCFVVTNTFGSNFII